MIPLDHRRGDAGGWKSLLGLVTFKVSLKEQEDCQQTNGDVILSSKERAEYGPVMEARCDELRCKWVFMAFSY